MLANHTCRQLGDVNSDARLPQLINTSHAQDQKHKPPPHYISHKHQEQLLSEVTQERRGIYGDRGGPRSGGSTATAERTRKRGGGGRRGGGAGEKVQT